MDDRDDERVQTAHDSPSEDEEPVQKPRELPADLPRSLDDRRNFPSYKAETEYYDVWQGMYNVLRYSAARDTDWE